METEQCTAELKKKKDKTKIKNKKLFRTEENMKQ